MTLITGIISGYKGSRCILLVADRAVSFRSRIFDEQKLIQLNSHNVIYGGAGSKFESQKFNRFLSKLLKNKFKDREHECSYTDLIDELLFSDAFRQEVAKYEESEFVIGVTDRNGSKLYHVSDRATYEIDNFVSVGSGAEIMGMLLLKSIYNPQARPNLSEAARLAAVINTLVSRETKGVSSNFDLCALWQGKIGRLKKNSKAQLIKDANFIVNRWIYFLRMLFWGDEQRTFKLIERLNRPRFVKRKSLVSQKNLVMIIDDKYDEQTDIYNVINKILKKHKLEFMILKSREKIQNVLSQFRGKIRFIILDRKIKQRRSLDILKKIRDELETVPVILLSRDAKDEELKPFLNEGIALHIEKEQIIKSLKRTEDLIDGIFSEGEYLWDWKNM